MNEKNTGPQPNAGKPRHYNRKPRQNKEVDALSQAVQSAIELVKEPAGGEKKAKTGAEKRTGAAEATMRAASRRHSRQKTSRHRKQHQMQQNRKIPAHAPRDAAKRTEKSRWSALSHWEDLMKSERT